MIKHIIASALLALPALSSAAVITTYTDRSSWEAAVGAFTTEDFESVTPVTASTAGDTFTLADFDIVIDENHGSIAIASSGTGPVIGGLQSFFGDVHSPGSSVPLFQTLNFVDPIVAFAADFAQGDASGITISLLGSTFPIAFSGTTFFGITSDVAFSTLDITGGNTGSGFFVMDNVSISGASVPEPAGVLLLGIGLVSLTARRKPLA